AIRESSTPRCRMPMPLGSPACSERGGASLTRLLSWMKLFSTVIRLAPGRSSKRNGSTNSPIPTVLPRLSLPANVMSSLLDNSNPGAVFCADRVGNGDILRRFDPHPAAVRAAGAAAANHSVLRQRGKDAVVGVVGRLDVVDEEAVEILGEQAVVGKAA